MNNILFFLTPKETVACVEEEDTLRQVIDLADIINADSYDAQVNRSINLTGLDSVNVVVKDVSKVDGAKTE